MTEELQNGCTDKRFLEWTDRAWAHEVVYGTEQLPKLSGDWLEIVEEGLASLGITPDEIRVITQGEFLVVEFDSVTKGSYSAFLGTNYDLVVICHESDSGADIDGLMTHAAFWDYLGSFPNIYKHLKVSNGRHSYWRKADAG